MSVQVPPRGTRGVLWPHLPTWLVTFVTGLQLRRFRSKGGGSTQGGAARHPAWLYNLAGQPEATVQFGDGRRVDVRAETLDGPELEAAWRTIATDAPEYVKYRSKTDREIPVLRLRQRS
jgi:deazaflavin-dependent oxidoreductase (nitroreductase family)